MKPAGSGSGECSGGLPLRALGFLQLVLLLGKLVCSTSVLLVVYFFHPLIIQSGRLVFSSECKAGALFLRR